MFGKLSAQKESGWLAVVPNQARVDLAHVRRHREAPPSVMLMESYAAGPAFAETLKSLAATRKLRKYRMTTLLRDGEYQLAQLDAPAVPEAERAEALRWRLKDLVDFPVDGASVAVIDIPVERASGRQAMVYAVAAAQPAIAAVMSGFFEGKVALDAIDIPELAQRNVAALFEQENRGLAFLSLDDHGGLLTITYRGELYAVRRIEVSATQLVDADPDRRTSLLERIMLELQRTLDNFDRQYSFISVAELLVIACPAVAELQSYLSENLYVPVKQADLSQVLDLSAVPELRANPELQARYLPAIGAALRSGGEA